MIVKITKSDRETIEFGRQLAKKLKPGNVIALRGNLGAGKTTLIKGIALGLGLKDQDDVKSPTFALMHTYETRPVIYHFDLYRLETEKEIANIGFEEFSADPNAVTCVEWPEKGKGMLPKKMISIKIEIVDKSSRKISAGFQE